VRGDRRIKRDVITRHLRWERLAAAAQ
jgi:hypothetical protein